MFPPARNPVAPNGIRGRYFLDELPEDATDDEPVDMSCGVICQQPDLFDPQPSIFGDESRVHEVGGGSVR